MAWHILLGVDTLVGTKVHISRKNLQHASIPYRHDSNPCLLSLLTNYLQRGTPDLAPTLSLLCYSGVRQPSSPISKDYVGYDRSVDVGRDGQGFGMSLLRGGGNPEPVRRN